MSALVTLSFRALLFIVSPLFRERAIAFAAPMQQEWMNDCISDMLGERRQGIKEDSPRKSAPDD